MQFMTLPRSVMELECNRDTDQAFSGVGVTGLERVTDAQIPAQTDEAHVHYATSQGISQQIHYRSRSATLVNRDAELWSNNMHPKVLKHSPEDVEKNVLLFLASYS
ncbi:hypothetical protein J6590_081986 [Homalodisca vitripennis]|nr:hypothetical protein J6590_081986 [Homalodisca vitripennis]